MSSLLARRIAVSALVLVCLGSLSPTAVRFRCARMGGHVGAHSCCAPHESAGPAIAAPCCESIETLHVSIVGSIEHPDRVSTPLVGVVASAPSSARPASIAARVHLHARGDPHGARYKRLGTILRV